MKNRSISTKLRIAVYLTSLSLVGAVVNVDDYGAVGDGVTWDHAAFRSAVAAAGEGGTVGLTPGRTYVICTTVTIEVDDLTIEGNGATVLRCPENASTLTVEALEGETSVTVLNPERFEVGMWIAFAKAPGNFADTGAGFRPIEGINGSVLSFNANQAVGVFPSATTSFGIGDSVFTVPQLFRIQDAHNFTMRNLNLDGNATAHSIALNWIWAAHIIFRGNSVEDPVLDATIDNVNFHDLFGDGIGVSMSRRLTLKNSIFSDLAGSAIHLTRMFDTTILDNVFERTSTQGDRETHADGAIEFSLENEDTLIEGNTIRDIHTETNGGEAIGLVAMGKNRGVQLLRNTISDVDRISTFELIADRNYIQGDLEDVLVEGNNITDAGRLFIRTYTPNTDDVFENIRISGNTMINSYLELQAVRGAIIDANHIEFDPGEYVPYSAGQFNNARASISLSNVRNVLVVGNTIVGNHKGIYAHNTHESDFPSERVFIENNYIVDQQDHCVAIGNIKYTQNNDEDNERYSYDEFTFQNNSCVSSGLNSFHGGDNYIGWFGRRASVTGNCFLSSEDGLNVSGTFGGSEDPGAGLTVNSNEILLLDETNLIAGGTASEFNDLSFVDNVLSKPLSSAILSSPGLVNTGNSVNSALEDCPIPVPEPSVGPLLLFGALGLAGLAAMKGGGASPLRPGRGRDGPTPSTQAVNPPEFQAVATQWLQIDG